jgi:hypothetical protein
MLQCCHQRSWPLYTCPVLWIVLCNNKSCAAHKKSNVFWTRMQAIKPIAKTIYPYDCIKLYKIQQENVQKTWTIVLCLLMLIPTKKERKKTNSLTLLSYKIIVLLWVLWLNFGTVNIISVCHWWLIPYKQGPMSWLRATTLYRLLNPVQMFANNIVIISPLRILVDVNMT